MTKPDNGLPEPDPQGALRRMLLVLVFAIGILIYSYGWTVTEIDLNVPQEQRRQVNLTRAMRDLLSPRISVQERELVTYEAPFLMDCSKGDAPAQADPHSGKPVVIVEPACAASDETITVHLVNSTPNADARVRWLPPATEGETVNERPRDILELGREDFVLSKDGSFTGTIQVPLIRGGGGQIHMVRVLVAVPAGPIQFSDTANQVIERMAQTIFMALVATTLAIPIAAFISFFAARNLMQSVQLSAGTMLMIFIMLALGAVLGNNYLIGLGKVGLYIGKGELLQPLGVLLAFIVPLGVLVGTGFILRRLAQMNIVKDKRGLQENVGLQTANTLITTLTVIFLIGALGGLGILIGSGITAFANSFRPDEVLNVGTWLVNAVADLIWSFGNLLSILGTLIELFIGALAGIVTAFGLAGIIGTLFGNGLRRITGPLSHILAGVMGAISGAILMAVMALFGLWASLLGILPLLIGGFLGGQALLQVVSALLHQNSRNIEKPDRWRNMLHSLIWNIGFVVVFLFLFNRLSLGRSLVDGTLPPQTPARILGIQLGITAYLLNAMLTGAILGGISGLLAGLQAAFPLGNLLYNTSRSALNMVRSIEPLIMGLVFVIWVGVGPFAGVLALTLHSIASLGKLYSEQIENIDPGPIEALQSTGANQLQTIIYAVVPQIIPPYIAFTMYRWDINVRMSTIIGFVGGGGIGLLLQQQINLLRYRDAGVAVLAIAVVVSILDYTSAAIRERLT